MAEDYYQILNVAKNATKEEIKRAYKKLALKYHPDKHRGDKRFEEKFKKINEAYAVLGDEEKKRQYDQFGAEGFSHRFSQEDIFKGFDIGNIFNEFGFGGDNIFSSIFGGNGGKKSSFSFSFGGAPFRSGGGDYARPRRRAHRKEKNQDTEIALPLTFEESVNGGKKTVSFNSGNGIDKIMLAIPKGIEDGKKLKVKGKGAADPLTGERGDLYCRVSVQPHKLFKREGNDLTMEKEVRLSDLVLGGKVGITTLDGKKIELIIPPLTQNNAFLRIKARGVHTKNQPPGNLFVRLSVKLPETLSDEQKRLFRQLREAGL